MFLKWLYFMIVAKYIGIFVFKRMERNFQVTFLPLDNHAVCPPVSGTIAVLNQSTDFRKTRYERCAFGGRPSAITTWRTRGLVTLERH